MFFHSGCKRKTVVPILGFLLSVCLVARHGSPDKMRLRVTNYEIDAELSPHLHKITAKAKVDFTALEDLSYATFSLDNGLHLHQATDSAGKTLNAERVTQDSTVRVNLPSGLTRDTASSP